MSRADGFSRLAFSSPPDAIPVDRSACSCDMPTVTRKASVSRCIQYSPDSAQNDSRPAALVGVGLGSVVDPVPSVYSVAGMLELRGNTVAAMFTAGLPLGNQKVSVYWASAIGSPGFGYAASVVGSHATVGGAAVVTFHTQCSSVSTNSPAGSQSSPTRVSHVADAARVSDVISRVERPFSIVYVPIWVAPTLGHAL